MADGEIAPGSGTHLPGYLDGAPAEDAFQKLIDKGLFASDATPSASSAPATQQTQQTPTQADATAQKQGEQQTTEAVEEGETFSNLDDFLTKGNYDRTAFLELPVTLKVDGKDEPVTLNELIRAAQVDRHVTQKSQIQAEKERIWVTEQAQAKEALQQQLTGAQQLWQLARNQLYNEFQGVNWNELQARGGGEFADMAMRYQVREGQINQALQQLNAAQQQLSAQSLTSEKARLLDAFPDWKDATKFQEARNSLATFAAKYGISTAEFGAVSDSRQVRILHRAMQADALQAEVDALKAKLNGNTTAALKKVRAASPMASPGARTTANPKVVRLQQVREAGKAGRLARNEDAQAAAFSALVDAGV